MSCLKIHRDGPSLRMTAALMCYLTLVYHIEYTNFIVDSFVILLQRADIAASSLIITHDRETAIDFTEPYFNLGIRFVIKVGWTSLLSKLALLQLNSKYLAP